MSRYIVTDLEMTGLQMKTDRILEIGAVVIENDTITDTFESFVNPYKHLDERITELTGITDEMVENAPALVDVMQQFLAFAGDGIIVGHNVIYDYGFLKQAAVNLKMDFEYKIIDTLKIARHALTEPESKSLDSLCGYFSLEREHKHRALDDAMATARLFLILKERFEESHPQLFEPKEVSLRVKKQSPITLAQKRDLNHLIIYHRIKTDTVIEQMTKNEASRMIDEIYRDYGRIPKEESKHVGKK